MSAPGATRRQTEEGRRGVGPDGQQSVPPVSISYAMQPIANAVAELGKPDERPMAQMAVAELKKSPGETT